MPQFEKIIDLIVELDPREREELLSVLPGMLDPYRFAWVNRLVSQEYPLITRTPNVCGGAARLIRTRIPIWVLDRMRQLGVSESDILRSYPTLRAADLVQAWAYADHNRDEIETAIHENERED